MEQALPTRGTRVEINSSDDDDIFKYKASPDHSNFPVDHIVNAAQPRRKRCSGRNPESHSKSAMLDSILFWSDDARKETNECLSCRMKSRINKNLRKRQLGVPEHLIRERAQEDVAVQKSNLDTHKENLRAVLAVSLPEDAEDEINTVFTNFLRNVDKDLDESGGIANTPFSPSTGTSPRSTTEPFQGPKRKVPAQSSSAKKRRKRTEQEKTILRLRQPEEVSVPSVPSLPEHNTSRSSGSPSARPQQARGALSNSSTATMRISSIFKTPSASRLPSFSRQPPHPTSKYADMLNYVEPLKDFAGALEEAMYNLNDSTKDQAIAKMRLDERLPSVTVLEKLHQYLRSSMDQAESEARLRALEASL